MRAPQSPCSLEMLEERRLLAEPGILAGPILNPATGHSYYLLQPSTWSDAEAKAVKLGGHLATINSADENDFVWGQFSQFGGTQRSLWIGLNDRASEGTFEWASGEADPYRNWELVEPNAFTAGEDYVFMAGFGFAPSGDATWVDAANDQAGYPSICGVVEVGSGSIGGIVFSDTDGDGVADANEPRLIGRRVSLDKGKDGSADAIATTNALGEFVFSGLEPGEYRIKRRDLPAGYSYSDPTAGFRDITLTAAQHLTDANFAVVKTPPVVGGSISGVAFSDTDRDGVLDAGEPRLANRTVALDKGRDGRIEATVKTNANGEFVFANLGPGSYRIRRIDLPRGYTFSVPIAGFYDITLTAGQQVGQRNLGALAPSSGAGQISAAVFRAADSVHDDDNDSVIAALFGEKHI